MSTTFAVWVRHEGDPWFHAIESVDARASVRTYCNGLWPAPDTVEIGEPEPGRKCACCLDRLAGSPRVVATGLAALHQRFDCSDEAAVEIRPEDFDDESETADFTTLGGES